MLPSDRQEPPVTPVENFHPLQPCLELRRGPQAQKLPQVVAVMVTRGLITEHDVIRARHAHDVVATGRTEERQKDVHIVLVRIGGGHERIPVDNRPGAAG